MKKLFKNIADLDKRLVDEFGLSEDLMQENAASSLARWTRRHLKKGKKVCILCGCGNNGADGLACARMLYKDYKLSIILPLGVRSKMAKLQLERAEKLGIKKLKTLPKADLYIDAIFGSGLNRDLSDEILSLLEQVNSKKALKLSCDVPTGISEDGNVSQRAFKANKTITMGALKSSLYSDKAKDFVGNISLSNLGVSRQVYEMQTDTFLLEKKDLKLPLRRKQNTNKGSFGHLLVLAGNKEGAAKLCAKSSFAFGAGLVSVMGDVSLPSHIMSAKKIPQNATALVCGMGLGSLSDESFEMLQKSSLPLVLDADILSYKKLKDILKNKTNTILTPHPKEFVKMSKVLGFGSFEVEDIQANRLEIAREFSLAFPHILVLKGANTIIAINGTCYINPFGSSTLAKGGSGDVLAGLISSLLAQGYDAKDAAINGVLAHSLSVKNFKPSYALIPQDIIRKVKCLVKR